MQLKPELPGNARVALRRLRSAFSLFKPLLPGAEPQRLKDELRWLPGVLDLLLSPAGANLSNKIDPSNKPPWLSNSI
ncbi:CHAD domain-containing protein [Rhizobium binxianense]|uniref:CHAD domain-containing protein n=1 Tax=Rhizobium binxianense TaxID=3024242 RepID=UPI002361D7B1|nr:CHAD domain-containing protein [Rhizobium sp. MJ37]MDC9836761.1 CHAD domain-containing protein [Rhizobium sp. MJ37]